MLSMIPKTSFNNGLMILELTRPKCTIIKEYNERKCKPQGRKTTKVARPAKYHNWFTMGCWSQIQLAAKTVGLSMSTTGIVMELRKRDPIVFGEIRCTGVARWRKAIVGQMEDGRRIMPGHTNGGHKGILAKYLDLVTAIRHPWKRGGAHDTAKLDLLLY